MHANLFWILSFFAVGGALYATFSKDFFRCAMGLLLVLFSVAGLFLQLKAPFLASLQLLVYAGGITILILFGIMMIYKMGSHEVERFLPPSQIMAASLLFGLMAVVFYHVIASKGTFIPAMEMLSHPRVIGAHLLGQFLLGFDLLSVLLLAVLVAAAVLVRKRGSE